MKETQTRATHQKMKILEHLRSVKTHPTAEMVYDAVRKEIPSLSLATVYRNLNSMAERGDILKLEINGEFRFDGDTCHHQHCVCRKCGKVIDVFNKELNSYALRKMRSRYFTPSCVCIIFTGLCRSCK
ncbi:transcriptional repressor [Candidatus Woesearchaeota archaeon]|nr:transcriptional repressor [Candidatus Woesearchaeota archaeon]